MDYEKMINERQQEREKAINTFQLLDRHLIVLDAEINLLIQLKEQEASEGGEE